MWYKLVYLHDIWVEGVCYYVNYLLGFLCNFLTVTTPQDKIIEELEAEIVKLKAEIADTTSERDEYQKKYDALKLYVRPLR